jgi:hypothetical protein
MNGPSGRRGVPFSDALWPRDVTGVGEQVRLGGSGAVYWAALARRAST